MICKSFMTELQILHWPCILIQLWTALWPWSFCLINLQRIARWVLALRKQPTFRDTTPGFPTEWCLRNEQRNSDKLITHQYRANWALGSVYNWLSHKGTLHQSIRSTTQIWEVTFCRVTSEGIMKCWLFSQVVCLTCGHNEFQWLIKYENLTFPKRSNSISSLAVTDFSRSWTIKKNKPIEKTLIPSILILWLMNIPKILFDIPGGCWKNLKKFAH